MKNIYDVNNTPLYSFNSMNSNAELFQSQYPYSSKTVNFLLDSILKKHY